MKSPGNNSIVYYEVHPITHTHIPGPNVIQPDSDARDVDDRRFYSSQKISSQCLESPDVTPKAAKQL